ncbi:heparinase II/III family protein [Terrarubrum flagellatum]|uniref:heparinase II/III family protein n=1 Tax=Terrirubrum flagellatum TaxID=2895980 RepID=UPI003144DC61
MSDASPSLSRPITRLRFGRLTRRIRGALEAPWRALSVRLGPQPTRLVIVPPDLRTIDPETAQDILAGHFALGGKVVATGDMSPFSVAAAPSVWLRGLYSFSWLRHLSAIETPDGRAQARWLLSEFFALKSLPPEAMGTKSAARRLIALLASAPFVLDGADAVFYKAFLRSLARHGKRLQRAAVAEYDPLGRLQAGIALLHLALSTDRSERLARRAIALVTRELNAQIAADGGHVGRNPETPVTLLFELIPLRQCFVRRGVEPPADILNAIDRMIAMVRHMRHADGALAAFNGAGGAPRELLATLIAYGDVASPSSPGLRGGYARLVAADSVALVDAAPAGPIAATAQAHAGCLSVEFSSEGRRWIVNCAAPRDEGTELGEAVRTTIAHSTATLGNATSARFVETPEANYLAGPAHVRADLSEDGQAIQCSHDGYEERFGVLHQRHVTISPDGLRLTGRDVFPGEPTTDHVPIALRFHIHPAIEARLPDDDAFVLLVARDGASWRFEVEDSLLEIEDSIYLGDGAPRRTMQIVMRMNLADRRHVAWSLERVAQGRTRNEGN